MPADTKSVVVVAHPDDESMWFGGLMLTEPGDWTVICCSIPRTDPIRSWKFFDAVEVLGGRGRLLGVTEPPANASFPDWVLGVLNLEPYDRIVTHGIEGGYGHLHHKELSAFIHKKYSHKVIWSDCPPSKSDYTLDLVLPPEIAGLKLAALKCYDHVLPYQGVPMSKWEALLQRYCSGAGWEIARERYRLSRPLQSS